MSQNFKDNTLYEMYNLVVLRGMNSETVDLIATDPPFNTKRNRSGTAGFYVDKWKWGDTDILPDQWKWNEVHPQWLEEIKDELPELYQVIESTKLVQGEDTAAFLCFLSVRLLEMHRVLKLMLSLGKITFGMRLCGIITMLRQPQGNSFGVNMIQSSSMPKVKQPLLTGILCANHTHQIVIG